MDHVITSVDRPVDSAEQQLTHWPEPPGKHDWYIPFMGPSTAVTAEWPETLGGQFLVLYDSGAFESIFLDPECKIPVSIKNQHGRWIRLNT